MTTYHREPHPVLSLNQSPEELKNVYDIDYYEYLRAPEFKEAFIQPLADIINHIGLSCLDVGCGEGQLSPLVKLPYTGIDGSDTAIVQAKQGTGRADHEFYVERLETYEKKNGRLYGTIVFGGILHVLVKKEERIALLERYREEFHPEYFVVYDLDILDHEPLNKKYNLIKEYHATAEVKGLQEVKKHRKILTYRVN